MNVASCVVGSLLSLASCLSLAHVPELEEAARLGRFHGVAMVLDRHGEVSGFAYGAADDAHANGVDVAYPWGSVAKPLIATTVAVLAGEGRLSLDDTVGAWLPELGGKPAAGVTLRQLLSHTGGVPGVLQHGQGLDAERLLSALDAPLARSDLLAEFVDAPLRFEPGERYAYSNSGYVLLALVVEKVAGMPHAEAVRRHVLTPAGVDGAACLCDAVAGVVNARTHELDAGDTVVAVAAHGDRTFGAGALRATPSAMLRLMHAFAQDDAFLPEGVRSRMWAPVVPTGQGTEQAGLGWMLDPIGDTAVVSHTGALPGLVAYAGSAPGSGAVVVLVANRTAPLSRLDHDQALVERMGRHLLAGALGLELQAGRPWPPLAAPTAALAFEGEWALDDGRRFRLRADDDGALVFALDEGDWSVFDLRREVRLTSVPDTVALAADWAVGDGGTLCARFDPALAAQLPCDQLPAMFAAVSRDLGGFRDHWVYAVEEANHFVRFRFDAGAVDVALIFDGNGDVAGLRLEGEQREASPRTARLWPLSGGDLLLDGHPLARGDEVWHVESRDGMPWRLAPNPFMTAVRAETDTHTDAAKR